MLVTFFAITTATVMVVRRSLLETALIICSAIPIALIANIARISVTGILQAGLGSEIAAEVFHGLAGWFMMPIALGLLWAEIRLLGIVLVDPEPEGACVLGLTSLEQAGAVASITREAGPTLA
jgi:exosortase/archaeosortase family protein